MKTSQAKNEPDVKHLLDYLNHCHDASMRMVSFAKKRDYDEDGNLIFPFAQIHEMIICDIKVELLLNSYSGAKKNQIVLLEFMGVKLHRASSVASKGELRSLDRLRLNADAAL